MSKDSFNWLDVTAEAYDQADSESHALLYTAVVEIIYTDQKQKSHY